MKVKFSVMHRSCVLNAEHRSICANKRAGEVAISRTRIIEGGAGRASLEKTSPRIAVIITAAGRVTRVGHEDVVGDSGAERGGGICGAGGGGGGRRNDSWRGR